MAYSDKTFVKQFPPVRLQFEVTPISVEVKQFDNKAPYYLMWATGTFGVVCFSSDKEYPVGKPVKLWLQVAAAWRNV